jgi:hypothetical protein
MYWRVATEACGASCCRTIVAARTAGIIRTSHAMTDPNRPFTPLPWACAIAMTVLGFFPLAEWIPGGHTAPWYGVIASEWLSGGTIGLGVGVLLWLLVRRTRVWPVGLADRVASAAIARPGRTALLLALAALAIYGAIALLTFNGRPLLIDEVVQLMQARIFADGQLARAASPYPEFFSALHVVDVDGRYYSQFPPGGPLMLLPGILFGVPWLGGPVFGACSAALFWLLARETEARPAIALGATLLFAAAPFTAFMAGSHMNHVPTLTWLLLAMYALYRVASGPASSPRLAALCGFAFGMAAAIRPVDAAAFAVPAAVWLLARAIRRRALLRDVIAAGLGLTIPAIAVLVYNALTTGDPFLFGYQLLWGSGHGLGFHAAPWGDPHTPARGIELLNLFFLRLQTYLYEWPVPSLVPVIAALVLTRRVSGFDRYLLWSCALLVGLYFAYWHDGFFLGPRFFYALLPALALWTARLPGLARERLTRLPDADRLVHLVYATCVLVALGMSIPIRARQYAGGLSSMRHDYLQPAKERGLENALILVRESWGAQLMARMWSLGVSRSESEALYRGVDSCVLELMLSTLERGGVRGAPAVDSLIPLLRDSSRVVASEFSPDFTERVLPGFQYAGICQRRIAEDRSGYALLAPLFARDPGGNIYARELHARDTLLFALYPSRPVFVLRAASSGVGAPLELHPFRSDSARREWNASEARVGVPAFSEVDRTPTGDAVTALARN